MQGETNQDYLRTTYSGTKATAGSVFVTVRTWRISTQLFTDTI